MTIASGESILRVPLLADMISGGKLIPQFQPIVSIRDSSEILGFEALIRYRGDSPLSDPASLFEYARRKGAIVELDLACVEKSFLYGTALIEPQLLFVNIRPETLSLPHLIVRTVSETARWCEVPLDRVILEITEDAAVTDREAAIANLGELHALGVRFAIDDVGLAHSHLALIEEIKPAFLKISHEFGKNFELDETKNRIVRSIIGLARDFSAEVILEGIETPQTVMVARAQGIQKGQGYLFSRPVWLADALQLTQREPRVLINEIQAAAVAQ